MSQASSRRHLAHSRPSKARPKQQAAARKHRRMFFEPLEDRAMMAYTPGDVFRIGIGADDSYLHNLPTAGGTLGSPFATFAGEGFGQLAWSADLNTAYTTNFNGGATGQGTVVAISSSGEVSVFATGLDAPTGIVRTKDGRLLVAEQSTGTVVDVTAGGDMSSAPSFASGLSSPRNMVQRGSGEILIVEAGSGEVTDITWGGDRSGAAAFATLSGAVALVDVVESSPGALFVSDHAAKAVYDITAGGNLSGAAPFATGRDFVGLAFDANDRLLASCIGIDGPNVYDISAGGDFSSASPWAYGLPNGNGALDMVPAIPASTEVVLAADGSLAIYDVLGRANALSIEVVGDSLILHDPAAVFGSGLGTVSADGSTVTIPLAALANGLVINAGDGDDTVTIDLTSGNPIPAGGITYHGGGQTSSYPGDTLVIQGGEQGDVVYQYTNATDGSVAMSNFGTIQYTGLEPIVNTGLPNSVIFQLPAGAEGVIEDNGDATDGLSRLRSTNGAFEETEFASPASGFFSLKGAANTTLTFKAFDPAFTAETLELDGDTAATTTFKLGAHNVLPTQLRIFAFDGLTFDLNGFHQSLGGINSNSGSVLDNTAATPVTLTVGSGGSGGAWHGLIQDTGGALSIVKVGAGHQSFDAANTYEGLTTVDGGELLATHDSAFGSTAAGTVVNSGASLGLFIGVVSAEPLSISGGGPTGNGALSGADGAEAAGPITLTGNISVSASLNATFTISGAISGGFGVDFAAGIYAGTFVLTNSANSYTGYTGVGSGRTLRLGAAGVVAASSEMAVSGTLELDGVDATVRRLIGSGDIELGGNTLTVDQSGNTTFGGEIHGTGGLTKEGSGTLTLSGANTYSGDTIVNAGGLKLFGDNRLSPDTDLILNGGRFDASSTNQTIHSITFAGGDIWNAEGSGKWISLTSTGDAMVFKAAGTRNLNVALTGASGGRVVVTEDFAGSVGHVGLLNLGSEMREFNVGNANLAGSDLFSTGNIMGSGGVIKTGPGTLKYDAANSYTGLTDIRAGEIVIQDNGTPHNRIPDANVVRVSGGALVIHNFTETIGALELIDGSVSGSASSRLDAGAFDLRKGNISLALGGSGSVTKSTADTVTISGVNTYGGSTTIDAGSLVVSGDNKLPTTTDVVLNAGGLNLSGANQTFRSLTINGGVLNGANGGGKKISLNSTGDALVIHAPGGRAINLALTGATGGNVVVNGFSGSVNTSGTWDLGGVNREFKIADVAGGSDVFMDGKFTNGGIIKTDGGTLKFNSGGQTFSDLLEVRSGQAFTQLANALSDTLPIVVNGGTFTHDQTDTVGSITLINGSLTGAGTVAASEFELQNGTVSLKLGGSGNLIKTTAANINLAGPHSYTGTTTINGGSLTLTNAGALGVGGLVTVNSGGQLVLNSGTAMQRSATVAAGGSLHVNTGDLTGSGTIATQAGATVRLSNSAALSGSQLQPTGIASGTIVELDANNIVGINNVSGGATFVVRGDNRTQTAGITLDGGMLTNDGSSREFTGPITIGPAGGSLAATTGTNFTLRELSVSGSSKVTVNALAPIAGLAKAGNVAYGGNGTRSFVAGSMEVVAGTFSHNGGGASFTLGGGTGELLVNAGTNFNSYTGALIDAAMVLNGTSRFNVGSSPSVGSLAGSGHLILGTNSANSVPFSTGSNGLSTEFSGVISQDVQAGHSGRMTKVGSGTFTLSGTNTYRGPTTINGGALLVNGSLAPQSAVTVNAGATLGGSGTVGGSVALSGPLARLAPGNSPGILTTGSVSFGAGTVFEVELNGPTAGSGYDQLSSFLTVGLGGATLSPTLGYTPAIGDEYTIVSAGAMNGLFAGLDDNDQLFIDGQPFRIAYLADSVVLRADAAPTLLADELGTGVNNSINVRRNGDNVEVRIDGNLIMSAALSSLTELIIDGQTGDDALTIDYGSGGTFNLPITYDGNLQVTAQGDGLAVEGGHWHTVTYNYANANDGSIQFDADGPGGATATEVVFLGIEPLSYSGTAENMVFNLPASDDQVTLSAVGSNLLLDSVNGTFEDTTINPAGATSITINTGDGADSFSLNGVTAGFNAALVVDMGAGADDFAVGALTFLDGALTVTAESVSQTATLRVAGPAQFLAEAAGSTSVDLDNPSNDFSSVAIGQASTVSIADMNHLVLAGATVSNSLTVAAPGFITQTGALQGTGSLIKRGSGTMTLSLANSYSGGTTLSQGTLVAAANNNALGSSGTVTIGDAASGSADLALFVDPTPGTDLVLSRPIEVTDNGGVVTIGTNRGGSGRAFIDGTINLAKDVTLQGMLSDRTMYRGGITGAGNVTITGNSRTTWGTSTTAIDEGDGASPYTFAGTITLVGTNTLLQLNSDFTSGDQSLADKDVVVNANTRLRLAFDVDATIDSISGTGIVEALAPGVHPDPAVITIGAAGGSSNFGGSFIDSGRPLAVVKAGSGTIVLDGAAASAYSGGTTINGGTLVAAKTTALGTGSVTVNGGTLQIANVTVDNAVTLAHGATLLGTGPVAALNGLLTIASNATVNLQTASAGDVLTLLAGYANLNGAADTTPTLSLSGPGMVALEAGNSSFRGKWNVQDGVVRATTAGAFGSGTNGSATLTGSTLTLSGGDLLVLRDGAVNFGVPLIVTADASITEQRVTDGAGYFTSFSGLTLGSAVLTFGYGDKVTSNDADLHITGQTHFAGDGTINLDRSLFAVRPLFRMAGGVTDGGVDRVVTFNSSGAMWEEAVVVVNGSRTLGSGTEIVLAGTRNLRYIVEGAAAADDSTIRFTNTVTPNGAILEVRSNTGATFDHHLILDANGEVRAGRSGSGAGVVHTLGDVTFNGSHRLTIAAGNNVTTGSPFGVDLGGVLINAGTATFNVSNFGSGLGTLSIDGVISDFGTGDVSKTGSGTLILNSANTYTGTTTIGAGATGTLVAAATNALGTGTVSVLRNTDPNSTAQLALTGGITLPNNINTSGPISGTNPTIRNLSGVNTLTGVISLVGGGGNSTYESQSGTLVFTNFVGANNPGGGLPRVLALRGAGNFQFDGVIRNRNGSAAGDTIALVVAGSGNGTTTLNGINTYTQPTTVSSGRLVVNGAIAAASAVTVNGAGVLAGTGTIGGTVTLNSASRLGPGDPLAADTTDDLTIGGALNLGAGRTLEVELGGTAAGDFDQVSASSVTLAGAALNVSDLAGVIDNSLIQSFLIADNTGSSPIGGEFDGMPEGMPISVGGNVLYLSYLGGDGNDVVLSSQPIIYGTTGPDSVTITPESDGNLTVEYNLNGGPTQFYTTSVPPLTFRFEASGGDDVLTVQADGNALPTGGIFYEGGSQDFTSLLPNGIGDVLRVVGSGQDAVYSPDAAVNPALDNDGAVTVVGDGVIHFTGLEPVDMTGLGEVTLELLGGDDVVNVAEGFDAATGVIPALVLGGTSGGVAIETLHAWNNGAVIVDTTASDGNDTVTVSSAANGHGNANLTVETGTGADSVAFSGAATFAGAVTVDSQAIAVDALVSATDVDLDANAGEITTAGAGVDVSAATLTVVAATGIDLDTTVVDLSAAVTAAGDLRIDETDGLNLTALSTFAGDLLLTAGGALTDSSGATVSVGGHAGLVAGGMVLGDGVLDVVDFGSLTFVSGGAVWISEDSSLDLVGASSGVGLVELASSDGSFSLPAGASLAVSGAGADIDLAIADDVLIGGDISAVDRLTIELDGGVADVGIGSLLTILGASVITTGGGTELVGGLDSDAFNFRPQATTSFAVDGGAPVFGDPGVPPGDVLDLDLSDFAAGSTILTLGPTAGSGSYSFAAPQSEQAVSFTSIETSNASIAGGYHLVLDLEFSGFQNGAADAVEARLSADGVNLELDVNAAAFFNGAAADIRSLTVIGSDDDDSFTLVEVSGELPSFTADAPPVDNTALGGGVSLGAHQNATATSVLGAQPVSIHFVGGAGANAVGLTLASSDDAAYFSDSVGATASGNLAAQTSAAALDALLSFVGVAELALVGAGGELTVDASSTPATSAITLDRPTAGVTSVVGDGGLAETAVSGFTGLTVLGGAGAETLRVLTVDASLAELTLSGDNRAGSDTAADTLRIDALPAGMTGATLVGGAGSDAFQLYDAANTVDGIQSPVTINGADGNLGGNSDTLTVIDSGDADGDTVAITQNSIDGLTGYAGGVDVSFTNIDALTLTATAGDDALTTTLAAGSDLNTVTVNGDEGADQFYLSLPDAGTVAPSGIATVNLNGDAGNDTFGDADTKIQPSRSTAISINGGLPTPGGLPTGDAAGDKLSLDLSAIPPTSAVIVTPMPGQVHASGYASFTFVDIEDLDLYDSTGLTTIENGDLYARGTQAADYFVFTNGWVFNQPDVMRVTINSFIAYLTIPGKIVIYARGGNDYLTQHDTPRVAHFYGEAGNDYMAGAALGDVLVGGLNDDQILGAAGDDLLWGDEAPTPANPTPQGDPIGGFDRISGGDGNDIIYAGGSWDQASGDAGDDYLHGGQGDDTLDGGEGSDRVYGSFGNDSLGGYLGADLLSGGDGNDSLHGKSGNDVLLGGTGEDQIFGDENNDLLVSGSEANSLSAAAGDANDQAMLALLQAWGATGNDRSLLGPITQDGDADLLFTGTGSDDVSREDPLDYLGEFNLGVDEEF